MANSKAALFMTLAMAAFAATDAMINRASLTLATSQIFVVMGLVSGVIFAIAVWRKGEKLLSSQVFDPAFAVRSAGEVVGSFGFVTALTLLPLSTATAMLQSTPLAVTMGAALFLGEKVGPRRWSAVCIGFIGVLLIIRPGTEGFEPSVFWAVLGIIGLSARDLGTRALPAHLSTPFVSAWAMFLFAALGGLLTLVGDPWEPFTSSNVSYLLGMSFTVTIAVLAVTNSLRIGEVSAVAVFRYTRVVFALAIAMLLLGERPDLMTWIGTLVIVGSGIYAFLRERRLARKTNET